MTRRTCDVAIIGGGIVGAACAMECAAAGMKVMVIEGDAVGSGATAAGMGHIVVMDDSEAQFVLTRYSQQLWREMVPRLPADVEYVSAGTLWVAADEEEMAEVHRKHDFYGARGVPTEILDDRALRAAEPNLRPDLAGALRVPEDAVVYPPCAARYFLEQAKARGTEVRVGVRAVSMSAEGARLSDGSTVRAGLLVNAAGAWSPELTPGLEVKKRKGHLVITDRYPGFVHHQIVELGYLKSAHSVSADSVAFNVQPRKTGQLLIGSSRQYGAEHKEVDNYMVVKMLQRACQYMPGLAALSSIRVWTGFRAATPDKLPLIGPAGDARLWLATGHEGLGITTSLATAKLLVDQIAGRTPAIAIEPYLPTRAPAHAH